MPILIFLREHSFSIFLFILWIVLSLSSYWTKDEEWLTQFLANHAGDAFGAFLIVLATKYFIERGSAESKDDDDD
jgi:hypothetical protein